MHSMFGNNTVRSRNTRFPCVPILLVAVGTGGYLPPADVPHPYLNGTGSAYGAWSGIPGFQCQVDDTDNNRLDVRSPSTHLANIRQVFNPAVSDLAEAFGVSRQAVYKWLSGDATPEKDRLERIVALSQAADAFREDGVTHPSSFLKMRAFEGRSMLDLIAEGRLSQEKHVKALIHEALARDAAYQRSGLAERRNSPVTDAWLSELSIPGTIE